MPKGYRSITTVREKQGSDMSVTPKGLGKGLDLLLKGNGAEEGNEGLEVRELPLADIFPNPSQPRQECTEEALAELAASINNQGVLQPILVRPRPGERYGYEIVAGERRWRASKRAQLTTIPALIRDIDDQETLVIALIENVQREDLNPLDEAIGLDRIKQTLGLSQGELAQRVGKSRSAVANSMRLLHLSGTIKKDLAARLVSPGHARAYLALEDVEEREHVHDQVKRNHLNVRQTESLVKRIQQHGASCRSSASKEHTTKAQTFCRQCQISVERILGRREGLTCKVRGNAVKGAITLSYSNASERERVMRIMEQGANTIKEED